MGNGINDLIIAEDYDLIKSETYTDFNTFYGTYDHYQRYGWYFDKIVQSIEQLRNSTNVLTGRFVYVTQDDAIFLRAQGIYPYKRYAAEIHDDGTITYSPNVQTENINGFRFIGYLTQHAKLLLGAEGQFFDINNTNYTFPYKIANDEYVRRISAYYFPTEYNAQSRIVDATTVIKLSRECNLRNGPGSKYQLLDILDPEDHLLYQVIDYNQTYDWYKIISEQSENKIGWVYKPRTSDVFLKIILDLPNGVPIREMPSSNSNIKFRLSAGDTQYQIINKYGNWYKIKINDEQEGWIGRKLNSETPIVKVVWEDDSSAGVLPTPPSQEEDI